jgi:hypothetical protein
VLQKVFIPHRRVAMNDLQRARIGSVTLGLPYGQDAEWATRHRTLLGHASKHSGPQPVLPE